MAELTQNSILRISDEKTLQLIDLYEKEDCLWNTNSDDYKNRDKRAKAAEKIAKSLDIRNFEAKHVMIKFKNLRNSYCQELKKISNSLHSGLGDEEIYRPRVIWFSKMDSFLRPHLQQPRGTAANLLSAGAEGTEEWVQMTNPEDVLLPDTSVDEPIIGSENEDRDELRNSRKRPRNSCKAAKRSKVDDIDRDLLLQQLDDISTRLQVLTAQKDDYFENFGRYVSSLLRALPPEKAVMLQPKIINLITSLGFESSEGQISQSDE